MTTPGERPIVFSGPLVRAIVDGRKTQTRRVLRPQPPVDTAPIRCGIYSPCVVDRHGEERPGPKVFGAYDDAGEWGARCPYACGTRLWVKEAWRTENDLDDLSPAKACAIFGATLPVVYEADGLAPEWRGRYRHARFMPRVLARIVLEVVEVRVERVQRISDADIRAEGVALECDREPWELWRTAWSMLHGPESWDANPVVWAILFRRQEGL